MKDYFNTMTLNDLIIIKKAFKAKTIAKAETAFNNYLLKKQKESGSIIHICKNHHAKMLDMQSTGTDTELNPNCAKNAEIEGSICQLCYAGQQMKMYGSNFELPYIVNTMLFKNQILDFEDLPVINAAFFRFEAFGDLINETQLINYINICKKNPYVNFAIWSKNVGIVYNYFKNHKCPKNLIVIISSLFLNKVTDIKLLKDTGSFKDYQLKTFTVYNYEYLKDHMETEINCGARSCLKCHKCYTKNNIVDIKEVVKGSDTTKYYKLLAKQAESVNAF